MAPVQIIKFNRKSQDKLTTKIHTLPPLLKSKQFFTLFGLHENAPAASLDTSSTANVLFSLNSPQPIALYRMAAPAPQDFNSNLFLRFVFSIRYTKTLSLQAHNELDGLFIKRNSRASANTFFFLIHIIKLISLILDCRYVVLQNFLSLTLTFEICSFIRVKQGFVNGRGKHPKDLKMYGFWLSFFLHFADMKDFKTTRNLRFSAIHQNN